MSIVSWFDSNLLFGILAGLIIQFLSIVIIFIVLSFPKLYVPISWLIIGISSVVFVYLDINLEIKTLIGFVLPYVIYAIILPFSPYIGFLTGIDTASVLIFDGIKLVIFLAIALLLNC